MKTLIAILLTVFLISSFANAQFENFRKGAFVGYGAEFVTAQDYNLLQTQVAFNFQFQTGKFLYGSQTTTMITDSLSTPFSGMKVGYEVWRQDFNQLFLTGHALLGEAGDKMLGGGVMFQTPDFGINLDIAQRYKRKSLNIMLSAGAYF